MVFLYSFSMTMVGCASVSMGPASRDAQLKKFNPPLQINQLFMFIVIHLSVYLDKKIIGETANKVYFYKLISPGSHLIATSSEFGNNGLKFNAVAGKNYFVKQYIRPGLIVGGANVALVDEKIGRNGVLRSN